jgi:hypothetical protein
MKSSSEPSYHTIIIIIIIIIIITHQSIVPPECSFLSATRHVHKVSFPLVPQLANLILREATAHT